MKIAILIIIKNLIRLIISLNINTYIMYLLVHAPEANSTFFPKNYSPLLVITPPIPSLSRISFSTSAYTYRTPLSTATSISFPVASPASHQPASGFQ